VFGGEFLTLMRFKENPDCAQLSERDKEKIMHIALPIGNGNVIMATDALESMGQKLTVGNNFYIAIAPESKEEAALQRTLSRRQGRDAAPRHVLGSIFWEF
jgi:PhnB protein